MANALPKGVRLRGDNYVADVTYCGQRRTGTAETLEAAILLKAQLLAELRGEPVVALPAKSQQAWTITRAIKVTEQVAWANSEHGKRAMINARKFAAFVGKERPLDTIDMNTLDLWVADLQAKGKADGTINRHLAAVSKVYTVAQDRGGVHTKPKFPRRKESQGRIRWLTDEEERATLTLLEQWGKVREYELFIILIDSGMRMGEALPLYNAVCAGDVKDVDFKTGPGLISVWQTKNDTPRSVPMTKRIRHILEYRAAKSGLAGKVAPLSRHSFRQTWDRIRSHLGFTNDKQFVPHALRHTCASRLVQHGVPLAVVQAWMGHKTITVTMRYAHLSPTNLMAAVTALEPDEDDNGDA